MIIGIGSDLVDINRIATVLEKYGERFVHRCFTEAERERADNNRAEDRIASYAKRWAAKEACAKALGIGIIQGVYLKDIGVVNTKEGKPSLVLTGGAKQKLKGMIPAGWEPQLHLSLSDEPPLAQAFVVISAIERVRLVDECSK